MLRQCLDTAAARRRRRIELRYRPTATAGPVGRAILSHGFEDADARRGGDEGIDRHDATWKTIVEAILRPCLANTQPNHVTEGSNYDIDLLLLQAQPGERSWGGRGFGSRGADLETDRLSWKRLTC